MPELPDLEVFSNNLNHTFAGKEVESLEVLYDKKVNVDQDTLKSSIEGSLLKKVSREGKELYFDFENGHRLAFHMMLHGKLAYFEGKNKEKYTLLEIVFKNGKGLALTDFQRQAKVTLDPEENGVPDALSADFTWEYFKREVRKSKSGIKKFLMDQKKIKGIGNAYADEILWEARIAPESLCHKIPLEEVEKLHTAIGEVLRWAVGEIKKAHPDIIGGEYRDFLKVHNHKKKQSPTGMPILKGEVQGRVTYYTEEQRLFS